MLADDQDAVAQREALIGIVRNRSVERRVAYGNARRSSDDPSDVLVVAIPHFDAEGQPRRDVMEVGIGELAEQFIHPEVEVRGRAPKALALATELFEQPEGMELAVAF